MLGEVNGTIQESTKSMYEVNNRKLLSVTRTTPLEAKFRENITSKTKKLQRGIKHYSDKRLKHNFVIEPALQRAQSLPVMEHSLDNVELSYMPSTLT